MSWSTAVLSIGLLMGAPAGAQEEEKDLGWFDTAEFSLFMTSGNAEAQSLALRNTLRRVWEDASFEFTAGALRAEQTTISRVAMGTPDQFAVSESSESELTAENYFLRGRYDRMISGDLFWYAGLGWERNEFAGVKNRVVGVGGVGNVWFDDETAHFKTDYGITYTDQEDVVENMAVDDGFFGFRFSWDYGRQLTTTTQYANQLILDTNVDESSDYRADMVNSLAVAMSSKMALQVSLQWLYDNEPALTEIALLTPVPPDAIEVGSTLTPLDELDTILTASLVVNF
jgi:putative salt-induced outer membrane protein YdiY